MLTRMMFDGDNDEDDGDDDAVVCPSPTSSDDHPQRRMISPEQRMNHVLAIHTLNNLVPQ